MTVVGSDRSGVEVNGSCSCGGATSTASMTVVVVTLHLNARVLPIGVRQHGVLGAEHLGTHHAPELVVYARVHVRYVFAQVTTVSDYFTTIWAILA